MIRINNPQYFYFLQQADVLRRSGSLCDAIISVRSQIFRAHRLVLACASRALAQQLARAGPDSPVHCTLEHFSPHTFQQVLDFTYTQALEVSVHDLHLLLRAAQLLEMQQLEEQCMKQLDTLDVRASQKKEEEEKEKKEENWKGGVKHAEEEKESPEKRNQKQKEALVQTDNHTKSSTSCEPSQDHDGPSSTTKKSRLSPVSVLCSRDSVITRPSCITTTFSASSSTSTSSSSSPTSSLSSPWTFPANMWDSVSTLRRIAENYSNFISAHSLQTPNQSSGANPLSLSLSTPHTVPLLGPHFQPPVQSSVMGYSGFHPHHTQNLYASNTRMSSIIKEGLLKRNKPYYSRIAQTSERHYPEVAQTSTETEKVCRRCSSSSRNDPVKQRSTSAKPGKRCRGCQLCGREDVMQHQPQTRRDHRGEKPYQCRHCPKTFSLKHQLDTHHRVHTGEKPFECRLCGQRSRDYSAMIKHLRTHGGAAPYQCTLCLEFCSSLVAMQRHVKRHEVQDFPPDWNISSTYLYISHISA